MNLTLEDYGRLSRDMKLAFVQKHAANPNCCYCGQKTVLLDQSPRTKAHVHIPKNAATREHIICSEKLEGMKKFDISNIEVACYSCNNTRSNRVTFEEFKVIAKDKNLLEEFIKKYGSLSKSREKTPEEIEEKVQNQNGFILYVTYFMTIIPEFKDKLDQAIQEYLERKGEVA